MAKIDLETLKSIEKLVKKALGMIVEKNNVELFKNG